MKNSMLFGLLLSFTFVISSCKDECKDVSCLNGGVCDEGTCICAGNYKGESCEIECCNCSGASGSSNEVCKGDGSYSGSSWEDVKATYEAAGCDCD